MKMTPLDIKKQEFKKVMRGYDPVEVDTFLDMTSNEFEELFRLNKDLREKLIELDTQLKDYRQIEKSLQQTLLQAQETTGRMYDAARKESDLIIREAETQAQKIVQQANADALRVDGEFKQLQAKKDSLLGRLRVLLSSELDLLKTLELGSDPKLGGDESQGTGKASIQLEDVLNNIDDDRTT